MDRRLRQLFRWQPRLRKEKTQNSVSRLGSAEPGLEARAPVEQAGPLCPRLPSLDTRMVHSFTVKVDDGQGTEATCPPGVRTWHSWV